MKLGEAMYKAQQTEAAMKEQTAGMEDVVKRKASLERDTTIQGTSLRNMTVQYDKINKLNTELLEKYNALLAGDRSENRKLLTDLEATRLRLQRQEDSLGVLGRSPPVARLAAASSTRSCARATGGAASRVA